MNKRKFLAPLGVSVAALLGGAAVPTQASTDPTRVSVATAPEASAPMAADQLIITRSAGGELRLADHESHASHASHASHSSHASGS
jgi:hypothetical protein